MSPLVRRRRDEDLPALVALLAEQQPVTAYPLRWPLPFPTEQFLVRETEEAAWVVETDGEVTGHVSVTGPGPDLEEALTTMAGTERLAMVSVLFVGLGSVGRGLGTLLLDTAVRHVRESERMPVLDVVPTHDRAVGLYRSRGWQEVGRLRPGWLPEDHADLLVMTLPR